ncbi:hypothetical protein [Streptomyces swartbergensis]|uniref:Uncharacterized protein n=1 Tax=Streptomyces swartbergensis TaxID=487165 RepID=A0A243SAM3_9ACTN|nr:hypothetical protein [Streptomyces swartbergensis]OUD04668.1 hypothetical protein CA983_02620 [Streptomyces swartbergensis]
MTQPVWWPEVVKAADRRRHVTGLLLAHATPTVERGTLRLTFADPALAVAWHDSRAEDALEGALAHLGWAMPIEVADRLPTVGE